MINTKFIDRDMEYVVVEQAMESAPDQWWCESENMDGTFMSLYDGEFIRKNEIKS